MSNEELIKLAVQISLTEVLPAVIRLVAEFMKHDITPQQFEDLKTLVQRPEDILKQYGIDVENLK
jgi:hypothetical protein